MTTGNAPAHPGISRHKALMLQNIVYSVRRVLGEHPGRPEYSEPSGLPKDIEAALAGARDLLSPVVDNALAYWEWEGRQDITLADGTVLTVGAKYDLLVGRESGLRKPRRMNGWTLLPRQRKDDVEFRSSAGGRTKAFQFRDGALEDYGSPVRVAPAAGK